MKLLPFIKIINHFKSNKRESERASPVDTVDRAELDRLRIDSEEYRDTYRESQQNGKEKDEAKDHYESLKSTVDIANDKMNRAGTPVRFEILRQDEKIYLKLIRMNAYGEVVNVIRKDITREEFSDIINEIEEGEGILFDEEF